MCVCLPAACWSGPAKSQGRGRGTVQPLSLPLPCGEEGVKRCEPLPGDVVAAEKEALQAGQAFHLSLERERKRERGRGKRERWRDVKKRRYSGRGHCIVTVVRALYPSPFPQSPCSSQLQHTASPSKLRMHTHTQSTLPCLHMERRGSRERVRERA